MSDYTEYFIGVCVAKKNVETYSDCTDGSYEMMDYSYCEELAILKHLIEGKNWTLNYKGIEYKGNSFNDTLIDVISKYKIGDSKECRFEVEE